MTKKKVAPIAEEGGILKGVPLPPPRMKYPLNEMEVGDAIPITGKVSNVRSAIQARRKRGMLAKFTIGRRDGKIYCWRIS